MLIYEVNASVDAEIFEDYQHWLKTHILHVLDSEGFIDAKIYKVDSKALSAEKSSSSSARQELTIHYKVESKEALEKYLKDRAPALREEALDRFGDRFTATRRVLEFQDLYRAPS